MAKDTMRAAGDWATLRLFEPGGSWPMRDIEQTEAARDGAMVFGALELSKSAWLLAAQGSPSGKASLHRLDRGDVAGPCSPCWTACERASSGPPAIRCKSP